jgi:hypothetical protein
MCYDWIKKKAPKYENNKEHILINVEFEALGT